MHQAKLARNYKILPFEFSKIVKDMKGKLDKAYLQVLKLTVQLLNCQRPKIQLGPQNSSF